MASQISYKDQFFYVSNMRFASLIDFALEVGKNSAQTDAEKSYVSKLKEDSDAFFPGYNFAIGREFPSRDERKFWARIFFDLAYLIFRREIGKQETTFWQYSAIGDSYLFGRMITRSVQEEEQVGIRRHCRTLKPTFFINRESTCGFESSDLAEQRSLLLSLRFLLLSRA